MDHYTLRSLTSVRLVLNCSCVVGSHCGYEVWNFLGGGEMPHVLQMFCTAIIRGNQGSLQPDACASDKSIFDSNERGSLEVDACQGIRYIIRVDPCTIHRTTGQLQSSERLRNIRRLPPTGKKAQWPMKRPRQQVTSLLVYHFAWSDETQEVNVGPNKIEYRSRYDSKPLNLKEQVSRRTS